jgi:hypothetical protein
METSGSACPRCGDANTQPVEAVWESRNDPSGRPELADRVAPPVPRSASTNTARFYLLTAVGLAVWIGAMSYLSSMVAARASSVFFVSTVAGAGVWMLLVKMFTGTPRPTADQLAALEDWKVAHRAWQHQRVCLACGETF